MTGKRFSVTSTILGSGIYDYQAENELCESYDENAYGEVCKLLNVLYEKNEQLRQKIEYQQEVIVDAIDSLMELPSVTLYLSKQWLDACEDYDSIEDMKNTFSERIKELKE